MLIELDPQNYPMTEAEADAFVDRFHRGDIPMGYGSGPGTYEETEAWVDSEFVRQESLIKEEEIKNDKKAPL